MSLQMTSKSYKSLLLLLIGLMLISSLFLGYSLGKDHQSTPEAFSSSFQQLLQEDVVVDISVNLQGEVIEVQDNFVTIASLKTQKQYDLDLQQTEIHLQEISAMTKEDLEVWRQYHQEVEEKGEAVTDFLEGDNQSLEAAKNVPTPPEFAPFNPLLYKEENPDLTDEKKIRTITIGVADLQPGDLLEVQLWVKSPSENWQPVVQQDPQILRAQVQRNLL